MTEPSNDSTLLQWLMENTEFSTLDELAMATGVELPTLRNIDASKVLPNALHTDAIKRAIPSLPVALLNKHAIIEPETVESARGAMPEASMVLNLGKIKDLQVGDFVPYVPRLSHERRVGSHWVEVRSVTPLKVTSTSINFGGVERNYSPEMSIRFARRA